MSIEKSVTTLRLEGSILCLDFINTVENRKKAAPYDYLNSFKDLLKWYAHTGALSPKIIHTLERLAKDYPQKATIVFDKCKQLRELLHSILSRLVAKKSPLPEDLLLFNRFISEAYASIEISFPAGQGLLQFNAPVLEQVYWWLIKSAVELFISPMVTGVKECPGCGWLFLDKSKNGSRKWCSMRTCGDVSKVKAYMQRQR
ncbi:CGNR zinc finger domain-containing protein [Chitinophaga sp. 30R24]|uniref:CGNR zinc finger domain-containing protein n=1 Tax=Chitinophaga sp. 30R24 TaxID=3248838 RepID=UPI003B8FD869